MEIITLKKIFNQRIPRALSIRQIIVTSVAVLSLITVNTVTILFKTVKPSAAYTLHYHLEDSLDISCYMDPVNDLPVIDAQKFSPPQKSIYFHETSCKGGVNSRQACAVESAARANPDWQITVLFAGPVNNVSIKSSTFEKLQELNNVKIARINVSNYAKGTPMYKLYKGDSVAPLHHASDILRYITLYLWGGVYLDLDVVVVRSFDNLPGNWVAKELDFSIGAGAFAFSKNEIGKRVAKAALRQLMAAYNPEAWSDSSVGVLMHVLSLICSTSAITNMSAATCDGFEVLQPSYFYPLYGDEWRSYFEPGELKLGDSYAHHVWNHYSQSVKVPRDSLYSKLAQRFCPSAYDVYGEYFGY